MILCAVDDLLFSVRISTTARAVGADVYFERSAERLLDTIRDRRPALVVFDLNSRKLNPIETLNAMKQDPALEGVKTLGFVSHVDAATISAAREAGCDQVLARSAFVERLAEILKTSG